MARNKVQFQKGLGLVEFQRLYGTEEQCHDHLVQQRWPNGFVCPKCSQTKHSYAARKRIFQCSACRSQTSVKSGTLFHASRTPLTKWYLAIHLVASSKNDVAVLELARQLDVKWDTAWLIKQKLMEAMRQRNRTYKLKGTIQIDVALQVRAFGTTPIWAAKSLQNRANQGGALRARPLSSLQLKPAT